MKDQFVLMYVKNNQIYPVVFSDSQTEILQSLIPAVFDGKPVKVVTDMPIGRAEVLKGKKEKV